MARAFHATLAPDPYALVMPDVIRHDEAGGLGAWMPACAGMTGGYTAS